MLGQSHGSLKVASILVGRVDKDEATAARKVASLARQEAKSVAEDGRRLRGTLWELIKGSLELRVYFFAPLYCHDVVHLPQHAACE